MCKYSEIERMVLPNGMTAKEVNDAVRREVERIYQESWLQGVSVPFFDEKGNTYLLDRFFAVNISDESFKYPKKFNPENYFKECFGIIHDDGCTLETIKLKVDAGQANYLRSLPMHHSQKEVEHNDEYSIFILRLRPTFDFQQELLWNGDAVEVLEPVARGNGFCDRKYSDDFIEGQMEKYAQRVKEIEGWIKEWKA